MRYTDYDEYSETDKFLDKLFREDAEFGWSCEKPQDGMEPSMNITVVKQDGEAEITYIKSIISEFNEKFSEILDKCESLPDERMSHTYSFTKNELISRLISMSNQLDDILVDMDQYSAVPTSGNVTTAIIGGGMPIGEPMF